LFTKKDREVTLYIQLEQRFSNFFVVTPLEKFAGLATHQQQDVNKDTYQSFIF